MPNPALDLRTRRAALGLSLSQLALLLSVPKDTISRWELGKLAIRHPEMLRRALADIEREVRPAP